MKKVGVKEEIHTFTESVNFGCHARQTDMKKTGEK